VTVLLSRLRPDPERTIAMVCGPELMMRFTGRDLLDLGIAPEGIWLSLERNMKCAIALCGHCQLGPAFVCREGPVMRYDAIADLLAVREL
jgi:NAD(P)H-flavin reductase